jgi:hypothetical protein
MRRRTKLLAIAAFLPVSALVGVACSGSAATGAGPVVGATHRAIGGGTPQAPAALPSPAGGGAAEVGVTGLDLQLPDVSGPKVIKTADLSLELKAGTFGRQFQEVASIAARHAGFVASSSTSEGKVRSGTIVIRLPADQFEAAMGELQSLGNVRSQKLSGNDVTAQYVDLQARLRNWETQETVLLGLLKKSTTIDESIKVQRALQDVQLAIEEIRGQLNVLDNQTQFSTVTVDLAEFAPVVPAPKPRSRFSKAWHSSVEGLLSVASGLMVALGYAIPFMILGLIGLAVWLVVRRRQRARHPAVPAAPVA